MGYPSLSIVLLTQIRFTLSISPQHYTFSSIPFGRERSLGTKYICAPVHTFLATASLKSSQGYCWEKKQITHW